MSEYFGDVVVYKGHDLESKILEKFIGSLTHSALRINRGSAQSINFLEGKIKQDLYIPKSCYDEYFILRHKEMTPEKQKRLRSLNRLCSSDYDFKLVFKLFIRKLQGYTPNKINMHNRKKYSCSSRIARMYYLTDLKINNNVHFSQIEPGHFANSPYFEIVGEWKR